LKTCLITAPVMGTPRSEGQFVLDTDASNEGLGAVLTQYQDGELRVIVVDYWRPNVIIVPLEKNCVRSFLV
jgi:hypothetical protein